MNALENHGIDAIHGIMIIIIDSFIVVGSAQVGISERRNGHFGVGAFECWHGETHDDDDGKWIL